MQTKSCVHQRRLKLAAGLFAALLSGALHAQTNFVLISASVPVLDLFDGAGCAWADYDADGYPDLFVANWSGNNRLYHNERNGTFTSVTTGAIVNEGGNESYGVAWGDINNDGYPDLFVGNGYTSGRTNFLYWNNRDGTFTKVTNGPVVNVSGHFGGCGWADADRDGLLDLFVANQMGTAGTSRLFHNQGDNVFETALSPLAVSSHAVSAAWADYNNDRWPDLLVANGYSTGPAVNFLYQGTGSGAFTRVLSPSFPSVSRQSVGVAWGDYDNDGLLDVFVTNNDLPNELYHNNGDGTFTRITTGSIVSDTSDSISASWGDYDNDGWLDLYVGNRPTSGIGGSIQGFLYHNNGDGTFTRVTTGAIAEYAGSNGGCAWGDYDNDGFLDLFVSSLSILDAAGPNALLHNTGNSNHWLKVSCVGVGSNRMGIGAHVRVLATVNGRPIRQLREITSGDGFGSAALIAHFGLGDAASVDQLEIQWPSGATQQFSPLPVNQSLVVYEPPNLRSLGFAQGGFQLRVQTSRPGIAHRVERSQNLQDWTEVTTLNPTTVAEMFSVVDAASSSNQASFYRVVQLGKAFTP